MFVYVVQPGDTIYSITRLFGVTTAQLLLVNPRLADTSLVVGQTLYIPEIRSVRPTIEVNGYVDLIVSDAALEEALPYLTYLSIVGYDARVDGTISTINETRLIRTARDKGVAPLMVVSNIDSNGNFSPELVHTLLLDAVLSQSLIASIIATLHTKNYYGVNLNFTELYPEDYLAYSEFLNSLAMQLHPLGYIVVISPRISALIEGQDALIAADTQLPFNNSIDRLILRSTEWVCSYRQRELSYIDELQQAIDFVTQLVSSIKILISIPNCCYDFILTGQLNQLDRILSSAQADALVDQTQGIFRIDPRSRTSHFTYMDYDGIFHEVLCEIDTNYRAPIALVNTYNLGGISFRNIDDFSEASFQNVSAMFEIRKLMTAQ